MKGQASQYSIIAFIQDGSPNRLKTPLFPLYILIINEIVLTEKCFFLYYFLKIIESNIIN